MSSKTVCLCYACFSQAFNSTLFGKKKEEKKKLLLQKLQLSLKAFSRIEKKRWKDAASNRHGSPAA